MAHEAGRGVLKYFPATAAGGVAALAGIASALGDLRFVPTGGVRVESLAQWKALGDKLAADWVAEMNGKGLNGSKMLEDAKALIARHAGTTK